MWSAPEVYSGSPPLPVRRLSYRQIADDLDDRINDGEYEPGTKLPSYAELAAMYDVSVSTAARAVALLTDRGAAYGEPGRGVYVAEG